MWPKLLRSAAVDAFAQQQPGRRFELPETEEILAFLADGEKGREREAKTSGRMQVLSREGQASVFFESRDRNRKDALVHRSYIAK